MMNQGNEAKNMTMSGNASGIKQGFLGWQILLLTLTLLVGGQVYAAQSITFYHNDILGSPVATSDENGNLCWRENYRPYGDKIENEDGYNPSTAGCGLDDNQRGYIGHVFDKDIGLTYMQARYYDPVVGRFMGIDPVGVRLDNQVSFNRYAYGNNNPYRFVDPDGENAILQAITYIAIAVALVSAIMAIDDINEDATVASPQNKFDILVRTINNEIEDTNQALADDQEARKEALDSVLEGVSEVGKNLTGVIYGGPFGTPAQVTESVVEKAVDKIKKRRTAPETDTTNEDGQDGQDGGNGDGENGDADNSDSE